MSLIHKALKKAEGVTREPPAEPPAEEFTGEKPGGLKSQLTTRTIVLLVMAVLSLMFMIYKKVYYKKTALPPPSAVQVAQPAADIPAAPASLPSGLQADQLIEEGRKFYASGRYDDALARFVEASAKNPSDASVYNNIGLIYKKKNDLLQAEGYYKKALGIKPDYPECLNNLGVLKGAAGDPLAAAVYLKKAIALDSTYADAYFNLAVLNDGEGNFREAISNYKLFLQYTDTNDEPLIAKVKERIEQLSE